MDEALRNEILEIIRDRTQQGQRTTVAFLHDRYKDRPKYHVRRCTEALAKSGEIKSGKGGYVALEQKPEPQPLVLMMARRPGSFIAPPTREKLMAGR